MKGKIQKTKTVGKFIFVIPLAVAVLLIFLAETFYFFAIKNTHENYSFTQKWKEYYSVEDWNLTSHAIVDIDGDNRKDMVTFTNCAFLSSVPEEKIPPANRCQAPGMSVIVFPKKEMVGQKLISQKPFGYNWLRKSYLTKTKEDKWKFYDMNGLQMRVYELGENKLFHEIKPSILDNIDAITYQFTHLGISLLMMII